MGLVFWHLWVKNLIKIFEDFTDAGDYSCELEIYSHHRLQLLLMSISNEFPTILQKNAIFQATNYEDISRGQIVWDEVPNGNPWGFQQELNGIPYSSVMYEVLTFS